MACAAPQPVAGATHPPSAFHALNNYIDNVIKPRWDPAIATFLVATLLEQKGGGGGAHRTPPSPAAAASTSFDGFSFLHASLSSESATSGGSNGNGDGSAAPHSLLLTMADVPPVGKRSTGGDGAKAPSIVPGTAAADATPLPHYHPAIPKPWVTKLLSVLQAAGAKLVTAHRAALALPQNSAAASRTSGNGSPASAGGTPPATATPPSTGSTASAPPTTAAKETLDAYVNASQSLIRFITSPLQTRRALTAANALAAVMETTTATGATSTSSIGGQVETGAAVVSDRSADDVIPEETSVVGASASTVKGAAGGPRNRNAAAATTTPTTHQRATATTIAIASSYLADYEIAELVRLSAKLTTFGAEIASSVTKLEDQEVRLASLFLIAALAEVFPSTGVFPLWPELFPNGIDPFRRGSRHPMLSPIIYDVFRVRTAAIVAVTTILDRCGPQQMVLAKEVATTTATSCGGVEANRRDDGGSSNIGGTTAMGGRSGASRGGGAGGSRAAGSTASSFDSLSSRVAKVLRDVHVTLITAFQNPNRDQGLGSMKGLLLTALSTIIPVTPYDACPSIKDVVVKQLLESDAFLGLTVTASAASAAMTNHPTLPNAPAASSATAALRGVPSTTGHGREGVHEALAVTTILGVLSRHRALKATMDAYWQRHPDVLDAGITSMLPRLEAVKCLCLVARVHAKRLLAMDDAARRSAPTPSTASSSLSSSPPPPALAWWEKASAGFQSAIATAACMSSGPTAVATMYATAHCRTTYAVTHHADAASTRFAAPPRKGGSGGGVSSFRDNPSVTVSKIFADVRAPPPGPATPIMSSGSTTTMAVGGGVSAVPPLAAVSMRPTTATQTQAWVLDAFRVCQHLLGPRILPIDDTSVLNRVGILVAVGKRNTRHGVAAALEGDGSSDPFGRTTIVAASSQRAPGSILRSTQLAAMAQYRLSASDTDDPSSVSNSGATALPTDSSSSPATTAAGQPRCHPCIQRDIIYNLCLVSLHHPIDIIRAAACRVLGSIGEAVVATCLSDGEVLAVLQQLQSGALYLNDRYDVTIHHTMHRKVQAPTGSTAALREVVAAEGLWALAAWVGAPFRDAMVTSVVCPMAELAAPWLRFLSNRFASEEAARRACDVAGTAPTAQLHYHRVDKGGHEVAHMCVCRASYVLYRVAQRLYMLALSRVRNNATAAAETASPPSSSFNTKTKHQQHAIVSHESTAGRTAFTIVDAVNLFLHQCELDRPARLLASSTATATVNNGNRVIEPPSGSAEADQRSTGAISAVCRVQSAGGEGDASSVIVAETLDFDLAVYFSLLALANAVHSLADEDDFIQPFHGNEEGLATEVLRVQLLRFVRCQGLVIPLRDVVCVACGVALREQRMLSADPEAGRDLVVGLVSAAKWQLEAGVQRLQECSDPCDSNDDTNHNTTRRRPPPPAKRKGAAVSVSSSATGEPSDAAAVDQYPAAGGGGGAPRSRRRPQPTATIFRQGWCLSALRALQNASRFIAGQAAAWRSSAVLDVVSAWSVQPPCGTTTTTGGGASDAVTSLVRAWQEEAALVMTTVAAAAASRSC